jgi:magnesium chelatase subunit H
MMGGFTNLDPESRRVVPDANGRPVVKLVYTVLESQYQSALTDAVQTINATNDKVCFEIIGYLLEELRDEKNMTNFKKDLSDANVFIGSLIFIEDLAEKVSTTLQAQADLLLLRTGIKIDLLACLSMCSRTTTPEQHLHLPN